MPATTTRYLRGAIERDITVHRSRLTEARLRLSQKDSVRNRAALAECWALIDALLDMLLEADGVPR